MTEKQKFFNVLQVSRGDVSWKLSEMADMPEHEADKLTDTLSDTEMDTLARRMGDILMDGGDYWLAIEYWIERDHPEWLEYEAKDEDE